MYQRGFPSGTFIYYWINNLKQFGKIIQSKNAGWKVEIYRTVRFDEEIHFYVLRETSPETLATATVNFDALVVPEPLTFYKFKKGNLIFLCIRLPYKTSLSKKNFF